jgi:aminoglycoside phosphotransferase (APT) family kinase protein
MSAKPNASRARYYEVILATLDREIAPEIKSERARFLYAATRRMLARLSVANADTPLLAENLAAGMSPNDAERHRSLLDEGEILDSIEARVQRHLEPSAPTAGAASTAPAITADVLQAYLRKAVDPALQLAKFRVLAGGRSKQTIMLSLVDASGREFERVIRRDLVVAITGATVVDEYRVLVALADRGYPVPRPYLLESDTAILGSAFMLMEKVNGAVAGDVFDPPPTAESVLESARVLGKLHAMPVAEIAPTLREKSRVALDSQQLRAHVLELEGIWKTHSRAPCIAMDAVFKWLLANAAAVQPLVSVVHGDYSYHNILYEGTALSAVMDWELVRIGHPAEDLGYMRAAVLQRVDWSAFMAAYREGGGPEVCHRDVVFYTLLGKLRLMTLLFGARQYFESGATDDLQLADVSIFHLPRLVQQASVEIRAVLATEA